MSILDEWIQEAGSVSWSQWEEIRVRYMEKIGLDTRDLNYYVPQHPAMEGHFRNWLRLLPTDTVPRLRGATDFESELESVIDEIYALMESSVDGELRALVEVIDPPEDLPSVDPVLGQRAYLRNQIVLQLRGDVNLTKIKHGENTPPSEPTITPPERSALIFVERRNECNCQDTLIFEIDDPGTLFGSRYGDSTLMFDALWRTDIEPDQIMYNEAFDTEGSSWAKTSPPDHPISFRSTDQRNRPQFFRVQEPANHYGDAWGDITEMVAIGNSPGGREEEEFVYDAGSIDWQVTVGI